MHQQTETEAVILSSVVVMNETANRGSSKGSRVCKCWRTRVPPTWLVFSAVALIQVRPGQGASLASYTIVVNPWLMNIMESGEQW